MIDTVFANDWHTNTDVGKFEVKPIVRVLTVGIT
jgi:hypothetical protein